MVDFLEITKKIVLQAGDLLLSRYDSKEYTIKQKTSELDIVTEVDSLVEHHLISSLQKAFPTHSFYAEESGASTHKQPYVWCIDPIDGSRDFVRRTGDFAIQVGLLHNNRLILGVVYLPFWKKMYWAQEGKGAYCNGAKINVSPTSQIKQLHLTASSRIQHDTDLALLYFSLPTPTIRGSIGLKACLIADGTFDLVMYKGNSIKQWDICAPSIIVQEAGGKVTFSDGKDIDFGAVQEDYNLPIIISNGACHKQVLTLVNKTKAF